jgi:hypothetical protein
MTTPILGTFTGATGAKAQLGINGLLCGMDGAAFGALGADGGLYTSKTGQVVYDVAAQIKGFDGPAGRGTYTKCQADLKLEDFIRCEIATREEVTEVVNRATGGMRYSFFFFDQIKLAHLDDLKALVREDRTNQLRYVSEWYDCEKFAFRLKGNLSLPPYAQMFFAVATSASHAFNVAICTDRRLYVVEPQLDTIIPYEVASSNYKPLHTLFV